MGFNKRTPRDEEMDILPVYDITSPLESNMLRIKYQYKGGWRSVSNNTIFGAQGSSVKERPDESTYQQCEPIQHTVYSCLYCGSLTDLCNHLIWITPYLALINVGGVMTLY